MAYMYNWANVMYRAEWLGNKRVCDYLKGIQNGGGRHPEQIEAWHTGEIELIWDSEKRSVTFYTDGTV